MREDPLGTLRGEKGGESMKYFKKSKGVNTPRVEVTYEEALRTVLGSFRDNDMTRDMLTIPNNIFCAFSYIYVEDDTTTPHMVLMSGLWNMLPEDAEYDDDGNRIQFRT